MGRPSLRPGSYFRCLPSGYFEGIDGRRGIAWRLADSISPRRFLAIKLDEPTPDHLTISREGTTRLSTTSHNNHQQQDYNNRLHNRVMAAAGREHKSTT